MKRNPTDELDDLEHYLVGLDELEGNLTSDWVTASPIQGNTNQMEVRTALQELLQDAIILSKD